MKFGGTSVADAERIRAACEIVRARLARHPVVVVSALAGTTDRLEAAFGAAAQGEREGLEPHLDEIERRHRWALAGAVLDAAARHHLGVTVDRLFEELRGRLRSVRVLAEGTPRARDAVLAYGERLSARIVAGAFRAWGLPAVFVDPARVVITDDRFGHATADLAAVRERCGQELVPRLAAGELPVLGGFVGASPSGETTTLGRGGSDTTAALLGQALGAEEVQIWSDVDGLMSGDPRLVPGARTLERVAFSEAAELALYGARVLHPDSIAPAVRGNIPVRVLNSLRPEQAGSLVDGGPPAPRADGTAVAVASREPVALLRVSSHRMPMAADLPARVLASTAAAGVASDFVLSSATTLSVIAPSFAGWRPPEEIEREADLELSDDCAIVCVVGGALAREGGTKRRVLAELADWDSALVASGALRSSVVAVVRRADLGEVVRRLHASFVERGVTA